MLSSKSDTVGLPSQASAGVGSIASMNIGDSERGHADQQHRTASRHPKISPPLASDGNGMMASRVRRFLVRRSQRVMRSAVSRIGATATYVLIRRNHSRNRCHGRQVVVCLQAACWEGRVSWQEWRFGLLGDNPRGAIQRDVTPAAVNGGFGGGSGHAHSSTRQVGSVHLTADIKIS